jgi:16S rRNA (adenine(1408)-N(1))-methyltransferase
MRVLEGGRINEATGVPARLREARRVVIDVGSGDGRWSYERAQSDPDSLFVALDPHAEGLKDYAFRASRKPSRGGRPNVLFVVASVESPPGELLHVANEVKVIYPWAALLRGLLLPERPVLDGLRALAAPGATFDLVLTYDAPHDLGAGLSLPSLDAAAIDRLREPYRTAGLLIESSELLDRDEALAVPSTWGRRLLHGRKRDVFRVAGKFVDRYQA